MTIVPEPTEHKVSMHEPRQRAPYTLFDRDTRAIIYGLQPLAVQHMLDFDYICKREQPSVAAMVAPTANNGMQTFYWGTSEVLLPIYSSISQALEHFPDVDVMINYAPFDAAYASTIEALEYPRIRTIVIIAEGMPERRARLLIKEAKARGVTIIGPSTMGGIKSGCFKIGNTGGTLDNIIATRLYRPGSVAFVSKSGGLSNELNNIIARNSDGVYEGIAIGGDLYPGSTFLDHLLRYEADPAVKLLVLLGEVGGHDEYAVCQALQDGRISKPLVAWCIGTCARVFPTEVQFGHAGALARSEGETAEAKNEALLQAGALVPAHFEDFGRIINRTYRKLVEAGDIREKPEPEPPKLPMDYAWTQKMGLVRKPANVITTIADDRGEELLYAGMPLSQVLEQDIGPGGVISLLWFKRLLPQYARAFIEMALDATATRDSAAAATGGDLVSALAAELLTVGPMIGGAMEGAAREFAAAYDAGISPQQFADRLLQSDTSMQGIGGEHGATSRAQTHAARIKDFAQQWFPATELLDYALEVERITVRQDETLRLTMDGCIGVAFLDLLRSCGAFTRAEADNYIQMGTLSGLFVFGHSINFIGQFIAMQRHTASTAAGSTGGDAPPESGIGGVVGWLWFRRHLPDYACRFIERVLMVTADHGPSVPGAHNTIVAARAAIDLVPSVVSGLLTIGPRFGGAIDSAAQTFTWGYDSGLSPAEFVAEMKQRGEPIMGIGHRTRSLEHPDLRVSLIKAFAREHLPSTALLDYALEVEKITTHKRSNLILNIDGCIACCLVDLLRSCGAFTRAEADEYLQTGCLNGIFVLGRSIGLVGHYLDQKRLKQGLYRHPWDDVAYMLPEEVVQFL